MAKREFESKQRLVLPSRLPGRRKTKVVDSASLPDMKEDPPSRIATGAPAHNNAIVHASILSGLPASRAACSPGPFLQVQRQYGNRYVERVLSFAREGATGRGDLLRATQGAIQPKGGARFGALLRQSTAEGEVPTEEGRGTHGGELADAIEDIRRRREDGYRKLAEEYRQQLLKRAGIKGTKTINTPDQARAVLKSLKVDIGRLDDRV